MPIERVTVYECVQCEGRGRTAETVRHLLICGDGSVVRPLTFELGSDGRPLF